MTSHGEEVASKLPTCSNFEIDNGPQVNSPKVPAESIGDRSVVIVGLVTFVGESSRGILFSALWPLCDFLGGNKLEYGIVTFRRIIRRKK